MFSRHTFSIKSQECKKVNELKETRIKIRKNDFSENKKNCLQQIAYSIKPPDFGLLPSNLFYLQII